MTLLKTTAIVAAFVGAAGVAQAATVDFGGFNEGDVLSTDTVLGGGIEADITAIGGIAQAVVFDTADNTTSTNNDPDLQSDFTNAEDSNDTRAFGNALIIQENQNGGPDDNASGGMLIFDFDQSISLTSLFLLDSAEDTVAELFLGGVSVLSFTLDSTNESDTGNNENNNEFTFLDFGGAIGDKLVVDFSDSGAVGEFDAAVSVVPVPAGLPLMLGGIGAFAWMKRRKKA